MTAARRWAYALTVQATLRDTDAMGHVNNAVHVTWFEQARTLYVFDRMGLSDVSEFAFILGSTSIRYVSPVRLHEKVEIRCAPSRIGTASWDLVYEGRALTDGRVVVEGSSVQVQYDYARRAPRPLDGAWRRFLEADLTP